MQCETVKGGLHGNRLIWATAVNMWKTGGIRCFYKGLVPGLAGVFPYAAIDMGTFEYIKMKITDRNVHLYGLHEEDAGPTSVAMAAIGAFTGALVRQSYIPSTYFGRGCRAKGPSYILEHTEDFGTLQESLFRAKVLEGCSKAWHRT